MSPEDKSRANLFILSDEGQDEDMYSFKSVNEAKEFMEEQDCENMLIVSQHTLIISTNDRCTQRVLRKGIEELEDFSDRKPCTISKMNNHYLEITQGLRNDNTPYHDLVYVYETYVGNLD